MYNLAYFLFGLLGAAQELAEQFQKGGVKRKSVNLSLIVFLRSDIFTSIVTSARESDKIVHRQMEWNDPSLLRRIVEERFVTSLGLSVDPEEIWSTYFCDELNGIQTSQFITKHIIPRPRDILFICKHALANAINHRHTLIEQSDIVQAQGAYSEYALNSLVAETINDFEMIEDFIYDFVGQPSVITDEELSNKLVNQGTPEADVNSVMDLLIDRTFLGVETRPNQFEFGFSRGRKRIAVQLARTLSSQTGPRRYMINMAFHNFLEIEHASDIDVSLAEDAHQNIGILLKRMEGNLQSGDYAAVLHSSASVFETLAKAKLILQREFM